MDDAYELMNYLMQRGYTREAAEALINAGWTGGGMFPNATSEELLNNLSNTAPKVTKRGAWDAWEELDDLDNATATGGAAATGAGLKGGLNNLRGKFKGLNNLSLRNLFKSGKIGDPELLGWDTKKGVSLLGGDVGRLATGGKALADTFGYLNEANRANSLAQESKDIQTDILSSAASNPLASQYLTADELRTLNQLKRGNYNAEGTGVLENMGDVGMGALKGGLAGLAYGGVPGAVLGAIGSGAKASAASRKNAQDRSNARLESLLQSLNDASAQYKSMRRPNFTGLGIQNRFQDMYR